MKISVITPVYGCRGAIPELHRRLTEVISEMTDDYEIIMVDDACPQESWESIVQLCDMDDHVVGIQLSRNFGQMKAILAGLDQSDGDWAVVMDCDLQDRPEEIPRLYGKAMEGYDVVFARRTDRKDRFTRKFSSKAFNKICGWVMNDESDPAVAIFSILSRDVVDRFCQLREQHRGYKTFIEWLGYRQTSIDVEHDSRFEGKSSYTFRKKMDLALDILTSSPDRIMRAIAGTGAVMTCASLLAVIGLVVCCCTGTAFPGWMIPTSALFLVGGIVTTSLGIVGIYVGNIFAQVKDRPIYIVRRIVGHGGRKEEE